MLPAVLAVALAFTPQDASLAYRTTRDFVSQCTPRDAGTIRGRMAANFILDAASAAGADVRKDSFEAMTPKGRRRFTNLVAEFCADPEGEWVILMSHYDTKTGVNCPGANDGASTTGLLVALTETLCRWREPRGNVMMIWTDGEESFEAYAENDGFWGSKHAAEKIVAEGKKVKAVICLDMLGDRDLTISLPRNTSPALRKIALFAAKKAGAEDKIKEIPELVKDDHVAFVKAGFKAVDLIDFDYGSAPGVNDFWHTPQDTIDKVSEESLLTAGKVVAEMLNVLL